MGVSLHSTELPEAVARTSSWSESWRGLGFWLTYTPNLSGGLAWPLATGYFAQPGVIAASFLAPIGAVIAPRHGL